MIIIRNTLPAAVIFDLDGLLIDSEVLWKEAEIGIFGDMGIELSIDMCKKTTGMGAFEMAEFWHEIFPWEGFTLEEVAEQIFEKVNQLINDKGKLLPGVDYILEFFNKLKIKTGVASGSRKDLILNALNKFQLINRFDAIHSAQDETYNKPHPAVYYTIAEILDVKPYECIAFEDSLTGIIAAKAAKMKVVAVPEETERENTKFDIADIKLNSLEEFTNDHLKQLLEI